MGQRPLVMGSTMRTTGHDEAHPVIGPLTQFAETTHSMTLRCVENFKSADRKHSAVSVLFGPSDVVARYSRTMSHTEVGTLLGYPPSAIDAFNDGKRLPDVERALQLTDSVRLHRGHLRLLGYIPSPTVEGLRGAVVTATQYERQLRRFAATEDIPALASRVDRVMSPHINTSQASSPLLLSEP
jgi:hypothetical protein